MMGFMASLRTARLQVASHDGSLEFLRAVVKEAVKPKDGPISAPDEDYRISVIVGRHWATTATIYANAVQKRCNRGGDGMFAINNFRPLLTKELEVDLAELTSIRRWQGGEKAVDWCRYRLIDLNALPWPSASRG